MLLEPRTIGAGPNGPRVTPRHIVATQKTLIWSIPSPHVTCRPDGQARGAARRGVRMGPELLRLGSERGRGRAAGDLPEAPRRPRALRRALDLPHVRVRRDRADGPGSATPDSAAARSEEHTSELQSRLHLVCRLLLEKKRVFHNDLKRQHMTSNHVYMWYIVYLSTKSFSSEQCGAVHV